MLADFSNFLMGNCMSKFRGKQLSHEPEPHENRSEASMMQCYRNRAFFEPWRLWVTRTNCFCYFIFFNCALGGLMHKLVWPSELFLLPVRFCWMCSSSDSRYSCPFSITAELPGHWNGLETNKCCSLLAWKWGERKGRAHLWNLPSCENEALSLWVQCSTCAVMGT